MVRFLYVREGPSLDRLEAVVVATADQRLIDAFVKAVADRLGTKLPNALTSIPARKRGHPDTPEPDDDRGPK
jgi:hypothetical protein